MGVLSSFFSSLILNGAPLLFTFLSFGSTISYLLFLSLYSYFLLSLCFYFLSLLLILMVSLSSSYYYSYYYYFLSLDFILFFSYHICNNFLFIILEDLRFRK